MAYYTIQQNKFMKTTTAEGGMRDTTEEGEAASIMQMAMDASTLCSCLSCCRTKVDNEE